MQSTDNIKDTLSFIQLFKDNIVNALRIEMNERKMNMREMAAFVGLSAPTFSKLMKNPNSQSIKLIEKIFNRLAA